MFSWSVTLTTLQELLFNTLMWDHASPLRWSYCWTSLSDQAVLRNGSGLDWKQNLSKIISPNLPSKWPQGPERIQWVRMFLHCPAKSNPWWPLAPLNSIYWEIANLGWEVKKFQTNTMDAMFWWQLKLGVGREPCNFGRVFEDVLKGAPVFYQENTLELIRCMLGSVCVLRSSAPGHSAHEVLWCGGSRLCSCHFCVTVPANDLVLLWTGGSLVEYDD